MRKPLGLLAAIMSALLASGHALAGPSDGVEIEISGYAPPVCTIPRVGTLAGSDNANFANAMLKIDQFADPATSIAKGWSAVLTFPGVMCNYNAKITLATANGGMVPTEAIEDLSGHFQKEVDYSVSGTWGTVTLPTLDTSKVKATEPVTKEAGGANRGDLVLNFSRGDGDTPLVSAQFVDVIVVKIGALY